MELRVGHASDWASFKSQKRYMKKDVKARLSVSLTAMELACKSPINMESDITLDARDDSGDSLVTSLY
jgi:hypothetical protein